MAVDRCVCFNISFDRLKDHAIHTGCDFEALRDRFGCGRGCSLCIPYVKAMLKTGRTSFAPDLAEPNTADGVDL